MRSGGVGRARRAENDAAKNEVQGVSRGRMGDTSGELVGRGTD